MLCQPQRCPPLHLFSRAEASMAACRAPRQNPGARLASRHQTSAAGRVWAADWQRNGHAMPISYEVDKQRRLVVCTASGVVTAGDVLGFHERIVKDTDFNSSFSQLVDCTAITKTNISPKGIRALAETSSFATASHRSSLATSPPLFLL